MPAPSNNGPLPRREMPAETPSVDASSQGGVSLLIDEAEAIREMLHEAQARLGRLVIALKQQRKQSRAVKQAMASLRQLQNLNP